MNGCIGFFDIAKRKFGDFEAINISLQSQATEDLQRQTLSRYLDCLKNYLCTMALLYSSNCSWHTEQKKAVEKINGFIGWLENGGNVRDIKNAFRQRGEMSNIWNCVHTEPLCVFDHYNLESQQIEFQGSTESKVIMHSRWHPCSRNSTKGTQFNCEEMLKEVAKKIGRNIEFNYDL